MCRYADSVKPREQGVAACEVVPEAGVEPARGVTAHDFESCRPDFSSRVMETNALYTSDSKGTQFRSEPPLSNQSGTVWAPWNSVGI